MVLVNFGCSDISKGISEESVDTTVSQEDTVETTLPETTTNEVDKPHIVFWAFTSGIDEWVKRVVEDINANENFEVEVVIQPVENIIDLWTAAGVSQSGFDFTWDWSGSFSALMRGQNGLYQPVNNLFSEEQLSSVAQETLAANTDDSGNIYGVPLTLIAWIMAYNLKLMNEAGVEKLPITWEEQISACQKLKDSGITPIVYANKEGIGNELWGYDNMHQYFDSGKDLKEFWASGQFVGNEKFKDCVDKYKYLYKNGYLDPDGPTLGFSDYYWQNFQNGKCASVRFASDVYNEVIKNASFPESEVGYQIIPQWGDGELNDHAETLGTVLSISKWTEYPNECAKAIEYFVSEKWQTIGLNEYGLIPSYNKIDVNALQDVNPVLDFLFKENGGKFAESSYAFLKGNQYDEFVKLVTSYLNDDISFEEFAQNMEKATVQ